MKTIAEAVKFSIEELKQLALRRKTITHRFRLPVTKEQAYDMIMGFYIAEVELRHREFIFDNEVCNNLMQAAEILTSDNSKFGLMLMGTCGNGKTTFIYAMQNLVNWLRDSGYMDQRTTGIRIITARDLAQTARLDFMCFKQLCAYEKILAIDDMGVEPFEVKDYGNSENPVLELIEHRYNRQYPTIITTNLLPEKVKKKYGPRMADRFNEMFDRIVFLNKSYRKEAKSDSEQKL